MTYIFFKWQPIYQISLCGSPVDIVKLRAFIFGSVMHLYWGYPQQRNYVSINNIHKVMNFFLISHFQLFGSFGIHAKYTKFLNGTPHTHKYTYTHTETDIIFTFYTF